MADLQQALERILYERLSATVTLARVFEHVPEGTPPPVVILADFSVTNLGSKTSAFDRFEFDIVSLVKGAERKALNALQVEVRDALDQWRPAPPLGVEVSQVNFVSGDGYLLPDEAIYYGTQRFACFVQ